jgi:uncharacterized coiled-coil DUF342 family protein
MESQATKYTEVADAIKRLESSDPELVKSIERIRLDHKAVVAVLKSLAEREEALRKEADAQRERALKLERQVSELSHKQAATDQQLRHQKKEMQHIESRVTAVESGPLLPSVRAPLDAKLAYGTGPGRVGSEAPPQSSRRRWKL